MGLSNWLNVRQVDSVAQGEIKELTDQFFVTLRAYLSRIHSFDKLPGKEAVERLKTMVNPDQPRSWSKAYEVEQTLVYLYDDETLKTELGVRSLEARRTLNPALADHYAAEMKKADTAERQRGLLSRLVNDLQWRYTVNEVKRRYSQEITSRTGWVFALALILFGAWTTFGVLSQLPLSNLNLFIFAALAGTWGAAFSMLGSLKTRLEGSHLDDMKLMKPWVMILSRVLIGTGAGCILYFFLRSGLLDGAAFPHLTNLDAVVGHFDPPDVPKARTEDLKNLALLIIWCFIAGFSEKLVPNLIEKTEGRAGSAAAAGSDRYRPGPNGAAPGTEPTKPSKSEANQSGTVKEGAGSAGTGTTGGV